MKNITFETMSKHERKTHRKQKRSQNIMCKHENISISEIPTNYLAVANGGLDNGVQQEEVFKLFNKVGTVVDIVMKTGKPYCFVTMESVECSEKVFDAFNGRLLNCPGELAIPGVTFYISFVDHVPDQEVAYVAEECLPPGLSVIEDFVSESCETKLLQCIDWETQDKYMSKDSQQNLKHRRVKHYGYEFMYGVNNVDVTRPLEYAIPEACSDVTALMAGSGLMTRLPDQLTVNQYLPGQGIPPHIDTHSAFDDVIVSLSLGSQVVMDFKHPNGQCVAVLLPRRSLLVMTGEARYIWSHGITPRKSDIVSSTQLKSTIDYHSKHVQSAINDEKHTEIWKSTEDSGRVSEVLNKRMDNDDDLSAGLNECTIDNTSRSELNANNSDLKVGDVISHTDRDNAGNAKQRKYSETESGVNRAIKAVSVDEKNQDRLTLIRRGVRTSFTFRKVYGKPCTCVYPEQCDSQQGSTETSSKKAETEGGPDKPSIPASNTEAQKLEDRLVHEVYEEIAGHFSNTRHSPWPRVIEFLKSQPLGSIVLDVGCGNGKYLGGAKDTWYKIGCDRSSKLCDICEERGFPVFVCDCLSVPVRVGSVDVVISIAVIHHLSTMERRLEAVQQIVKVLRPGGQALIYVWALEQELNKQKSNYLKQSKIDKENQESRLSVTGVVSKGTDSAFKSSEEVIIKKSELSATTEGLEANGTKIGSLEESKNQESRFSTTDAFSVSIDSQIVSSNEQSVGETVKQESADKTQYLPVHINRTPFVSQDLLVPWHLRDTQTSKKSTEQKIGERTSNNDNLTNNAEDKKKDESVYHRYYHVFKQGELEDLCNRLEGVSILESYYDKGNWCVILEKK